MSATADLVARMIAAHNDRDDEALRRSYAPGAVVSPGGSPEPVPAAAWVAGLATLRESFPDLHFRVRALAAGPRVALVELTMTGSNDGLLHLSDADRIVLRTQETTLPPTGRPMSIDGVVVIETEDGLVTAERHHWPQIEPLVQLGLVMAEVR